MKTTIKRKLFQRSRGIRHALFGHKIRVDGEYLGLIRILESEYDPNTDTVTKDISLEKMELFTGVIEYPRDIRTSASAESVGGTIIDLFPETPIKLFTTLALKQGDLVIDCRYDTSGRPEVLQLFDVGRSLQDNSNKSSEWMKYILTMSSQNPTEGMKNKYFGLLNGA